MRDTKSKQRSLRPWKYTNKSGTMANSKKVAVKLIVDKKKRRVVLAESGKDFVDILFSFLTMPLGTVIRLLGNKSSSSKGNFVNIYESVVNLDTSYFLTEACKTMLLRPRNSVEVKCEDLAINIDDTEPRTVFTCKDCTAKSKYSYSTIPGTRCSCGGLMSQVNKWQRNDRKAHGDGVFVNGELTFSITDDLNVSTASAAVLMRMFKVMEIEDAGKLEDRNLDLGREEIASLLWGTLTSTSPLTDLCFNTPEKVSARGQMKEDMIQPKHESESSVVDRNSKEIKLKLVLNKQSNELLFAEADEDMVDLLFSWLTFPLGLLAKHAKDMPQGCIGNLLKCLECHGLVESEECKLMLLSPKLASFHGCSNQLLNADEMVSETRHISGCTTHFWNGYGNVKVPAEFKQVNPRSPNSGTEVGGGYARAFTKYMVFDDLRVLPFSQQTFLLVLREFRIPASSIVEREVSLGETQALDLLRAAFFSRTALSDVFLPVRKHSLLPYANVQ